MRLHSDFHSEVVLMWQFWVIYEVTTTRFVLQRGGSSSSWYVRGLHLSRWLCHGLQLHLHSTLSTAWSAGTAKDSGCLCKLWLVQSYSKENIKCLREQITLKMKLFHLKKQYKTFYWNTVTEKNLKKITWFVKLSSQLTPTCSVCASLGKGHWFYRLTNPHSVVTIAKAP